MRSCIVRTSIGSSTWSISRASRIEIAHVQYYGWALKNRAALMPSREQVERAATTVAELRARHHGRIVIDAVVPDYYARYPKPCVGGWGRRSLNVTPAGKVLPCHAAESITGLEFWNVRERSLANIWANSLAFNAFRGTEWIKEPCASCPRRELDFGGCRRQAFALTGDATATDPVCHLAPDHAEVARLAASRPTPPMITGACDRSVHNDAPDAFAISQRRFVTDVTWGADVGTPCPYRVTGLASGVSYAIVCTCVPCWV
jgi:coenzyme PQQ biosynthesis enzyme PqqE